MEVVTNCRVCDVLWRKRQACDILPGWRSGAVVNGDAGEIRPQDVDLMGKKWPWLRYGSSQTPGQRLTATVVSDTIVNTSIQPCSVLIPTV